MRTAFILSIGLVLASCGASSEEQVPQSATVTVAAGAFDRVGTIVSFVAPDPWTANDARLTDVEGRRVPLQRDPDGRFSFLIDSLGADEMRTYRLEAETDTARNEAAAGATATVKNGGVSFAAGDRQVLTYHFEETDLPRADIDTIYSRGGYIHPVFTPSGVLVTDDYPPNHKHHHGIWAAWTRTRYEGRTPDFWNMGDGTGTVEPIGLDTSWSGAVHAGLQARNQYVDLSGREPETVLLETWATRVYAVPSNKHHLFDVHVIQVNTSDSTLYLPEYHYGGVGFRGHRQWNGAENAVFLTSQGRDRSDGHATRARWCHVGGQVDGEWAGIAILDHPENFRAPQPMRIHPDEPFFNYAPSQAGEWSIEPGERYEARYRYVVYDGEPNPDEIDHLWNDYAHPPVVTVEYD